MTLFFPSVQMQVQEVKDMYNWVIDETSDNGYICGKKVPKRFFNEEPFSNH